MKFSPFSEIETIFVGVIASALNCHNLVGIFVHLLIWSQERIKRRALSNEINGHRRPFYIESMQHIISSIIEFQNLSLV